MEKDKNEIINNEIKKSETLQKEIVKLENRKKIQKGYSSSFF